MEEHLPEQHKHRSTKLKAYYICLHVKTKQHHNDLMDMKMGVIFGATQCSHYHNL